MYAMTWREAEDEAADWFMGTPAAGSADAMRAAYKRDKRRGPQRPQTHWEFLQSGNLLSQPHRSKSWWTVNADRMGNERGEWSERPRLLGRKRS